MDRIMRNLMFCILLMTFLTACAENYADKPIIGDAACFQAYINRPWNPLDQGLNGYVFYDCQSKRIISSGAQNQSSLASMLPSPSGVSSNLVSKPLVP